MIGRREVLRVAVIGSVLCAPRVAAGRPAKVYRIGVLHPAASSNLGWLKLLRSMGYVEGENLVVERRYAAGKPERLGDLAADLVRLKVDVIVATSVAAVLAAKNATTTIPIVMAYASNPVERGLVASLARPGGTSPGLPMRLKDRLCQSAWSSSRTPSRGPNDWEC